MLLSKHRKKSHGENRLQICFFCYKKPKTAHKIQGAIEEKIEKLHSGFNVNDICLPAVICEPCRQKLIKAVKNECDRSIIDIPDYYSFLSPLNRANVVLDYNCACELCVEVRSRFDRNVNQPGLKKSSSDTVKKCLKCDTVIARGKSHKCNSQTLVKNVSNNLSNLEPKQKEHILCAMLKDCTTKTEKQIANLSVNLSQSRGKPLNILVQPKIEQNKQLTFEHLNNLQTKHSFSDRQMVGITKTIREGTGNRNSIEPHFKDSKKVASHVLDQFLPHEVSNSSALSKIRQIN